MKSEQEMFDLFVEIAKEDERIRAIYLHGSRANPNAWKDEYSDYDVVFVVSEIKSFISDNNWLSNFGDIYFVFEAYRNENDYFMNEINDLSRRYVWSMILKDGNCIDLVIEIVEEAMRHSHIKDKPVMVLFDKDSLLPVNDSPTDIICAGEKPAKEKYYACCTAFWWFLNDVSKAIKRDQLPYAMERFRLFNRFTLNQMIDWYIGTQNDFSVSPGDSGRFYKKYLSEELYELYLKTYSDGYYENFWDAIFYTCELFRKVAKNVGDYLGLVYNQQQEEVMLEYIKIRLDKSVKECKGK